MNVTAGDRAAGPSAVPRRSWVRAVARVGWRIVRLPLIAYVTIVLLAMWFENSLIYFPTRYPHGDWQPAGLDVEDAWFSSGDGVRLHGWFVAREQPSAVILFCHGNGGNVTHRTDLLRVVPRYANASILVFDYRGYGRSEGVPHEAGILADARAARKWLADRAGVAEQEIVVMGESLGGAVAVDLAATDGARGLILENTFTSLVDVGSYHYPWLPVRLAMRSRLDSLSKIARYRGPLLQFHGDGDRIVPYAFGTRLHAAANSPKRFVTVPRGDHNDPRLQVHYDAICDFLAGLTQ
jgi:fermentation-respiration switch protein FrsA (DUF1100 family)